MHRSSSLMFSWTHSDSILSAHHLGVSATKIRLLFCVRECTCPPPISISLSLASKCLILLLGQDDGLHYNVQSVEYPFSWLISPRWGSALKNAHGQMLCFVFMDNILSYKHFLYLCSTLDPYFSSCESKHLIICSLSILLKSLRSVCFLWINSKDPVTSWRRVQKGFYKQNCSLMKTISGKPQWQRESNSMFHEFTLTYN